jgi:UDP-N-acetylmuramoyl-L-alanyl-D-glutamate--2,6-diaminopimelate ligase
VGTPNLSNIAAVVATAEATGVPVDAIEEGLRRCEPVPGRLERIGRSLPVVLVDYAHTPDALERTLLAVGRRCRGRLVVVFGCGGDRDRGKRPMMGEIAGRLAQVAVLTSDNPRSEEPAAILAEIEAGVERHLARATHSSLGERGASGYLVEEDRERAITAALALAGDEDVVVVAGKGHEDYQEIAGQRRHFDDRETVRGLQCEP